MASSRFPGDAAHGEATRFLSPVLSDLAHTDDRAGGRGLARIGLILRTRLLDAPPSVAPWLVRYIDAAPLAGLSQRTDIAHAVRLLGALGAQTALPILLDLAVRIAEDPEADRERGSPIFGALGQAFRELRPALVTALIGYLDGNPRDVGMLLGLVTDAGTQDERLLTICVEALERLPCDAATALLLHGDTRALPALRARLARLPAEGADDPWCRATMSLTHAIVELGGELDDADRRRADVALDTHRALYAAAAAEPDAADHEEVDWMASIASAPARAAMAANAHVEPTRAAATLARLASDRDSGVRLAVACAMSTPSMALALLAHDADPAVADVARRRLAGDVSNATPAVVDADRH